MRGFSVLLAMAASLALSGCIARTAVDVVTAPVRAVGKAYDWATVSQSEKDEKRGRVMREREERLGKLERRYENQLEDCEDGSRKACKKARKTYAEIEDLMPSMPRAPADWQGDGSRNR